MIAVDWLCPATIRAAVATPATPQAGGQAEQLLNALPRIRLRDTRSAFGSARTWPPPNDRSGMEPEAAKIDRRARLVRNVVLVLAVAGVLHFVLSLVSWCLFYVISYRVGWRHVQNITYGVCHLSPAIILLGLFAWTSIASLRRRRFTIPLLACSVLLSLGVFAVEVRGEPQFQRVWIDGPMACTNRQSYFCTWWWWRPSRH